jgi:hypothetical protein
MTKASNSLLEGTDEMRKMKVAKVFRHFFLRMTDGKVRRTGTVLTCYLIRYLVPYLVYSTVRYVPVTRPVGLTKQKHCLLYLVGPTVPGTTGYKYASCEFCSRTSHGQNHTAVWYGTVDLESP